MRRTYDSTRRREVADQTRKDIVQAAIKLHWDGITNFASMAAEAGCSVSTVRRHYPTREHLFRDCTQTFGETLEMPDPAAISAIPDPTERVERAVHELLRVHEAMFGYAWLGAHVRRESPSLDAVMTSYEGLTDALSDVVSPAGSAKPGLVRGLLDFLTYRALRVSGGLSRDQARREIHQLVRQALEFALPNETGSST